MRSWPKVLSPLLVLAVILALAGCQWLGGSQVAETEAVPATPSSPPTPAPPPGKYLDFNDVKLPSNLTLDRESSFVYESATVKAGILRFFSSGSAGEALAFFEENMPKDKWSMLSSFKYNKNITIYTKPGKICLIVVDQPRNMNDVRVEVWVAPLKPGQDPREAMMPATGVLPLKKRAGPREETLNR